MRFIIGSDHGGFELKEQIKSYLSAKGLEVEDVVPRYANPIPYVDVTLEVCKTVLREKDVLGILLCGTGSGICMAANRVRGIRASVLYNEFTAEYSKRHTNANVIIFGGRTMTLEEAARRIEIFLDSPYEGGKYEERNRLLDTMEFICLK